MPLQGSLVGQDCMASLNEECLLRTYAVLGVEGNSGARRLVRALLADPLAAEHAWEKRLLEASETDGKAVLLR